MKVVWTEDALRDLAEIVDYVAANYSTVGPALELRIRAVVSRIGRWPESARRSAHRDGVRVVPLGRFPYKLFYRIGESAVEILHIHHAARQPWDEQS